MAPSNAVHDHVGAPTPPICLRGTSPARRHRRLRCRYPKRSKTPNTTDDSIASARRRSIPVIATGRSVAQVRFSREYVLNMAWKTWYSTSSGTRLIASWGNCGSPRILASRLANSVSARCLQNHQQSYLFSKAPLSQRTPRPHSQYI